MDPVKERMSKKSHLLFDDHPLVVNPQLAKLIGLNEAIVLQQVHYWVNLNEKAGKNFKDDFTWTYNTLKAWQEQFPFWSAMTIRRTIASLEKSGYLISANLNKMRSDKTKWYRVAPDILERVNSPDVQNEQSVNVQDEQSIGSNRTSGVSNLSAPLPETTAETPEETTAKTTLKAEPSPVDVVFKAIHAFYGYPDRSNKDPIPSYPIEGQSIKKMIKRGFSPEQIITLWAEKVKARKMYIPMAWINNDIAGAPEPIQESSTVVNYQYFCSQHFRKFANEYHRDPDSGEMQLIRDWVTEKIAAGWSMPEIIDGDPSEALKVEL